MSILQMSQVWALEKLEPSEKLVLLCIADFASDDGDAWPSIPTLAVKSCLSEDTVRRKLKALVKTGLLTMTPRKDQSGRDTSYGFKLFPKVSANVSRGEGCNLLPSQNATLPLHHATLEGSTVLPSFLNHHIEPSKEPLPLFTSFWSTYPRKVGKAAAEKAWSRLKPDDSLFKAILDALDWQRQQPEWQKDGGRFIPHAATWLNARRWEDERPAVAAPSTASTSCYGGGGNSLADLREKGLLP